MSKQILKLSDFFYVTIDRSIHYDDGVILFEEIMASDEIPRPMKTLKIEYLGDRVFINKKVPFAFRREDRNYYGYYPTDEIVIMVKTLFKTHRKHEYALIMFKRIQELLQSY